MAKLYLEFDDGHRVELQYDGDWLFYHADEEHPNGHFQKNITPEWMKEHIDMVIERAESGHAMTPKKYMIHGIVEPEAFRLVRPRQ